MEEVLQTNHLAIEGFEVLAATVGEDSHAHGAHGVVLNLAGSSRTWPFFISGHLQMEISALIMLQQEATERTERILCSDAGSVLWR